MRRIVYYIRADMQSVYNHSRNDCGISRFEISLALKVTLQITAVNFLYLAVLPIIPTLSEGRQLLVGVIIAFVYGYGGMFAAGNMRH